MDLRTGEFKRSTVNICLYLFYRFIVVYHPKDEGQFAHVVNHVFSSLKNTGTLESIKSTDRLLFYFNISGDMKSAVGIPLVATIFVFMVSQTILLVQPSNAASLITVPTDFPTIQAAIDAASHGDTINVLPGKYTEQLTITDSLTLIGSGTKATIIKAPIVVVPGLNGIPNIIEIGDGAKVTMKGFTISGSDDKGFSRCGGLTAVSVQENADIRLDSMAIKDCNMVAVRVGANDFFGGPLGPQVGHATITRTDVSGYKLTGLVAFTEGSTLTVSRSRITAAEEVIGPIGIFISGAKGVITHNQVSGNICKLFCGPDFVTQFQGFGIAADSVDTGSVISSNVVSNNDAGILVEENNQCCKIDHNTLTKNRFFGIIVLDGEQTISNTKISGGNVGVLAVAFSVDTVAKLDRVLIRGATIPTQELPVGAEAEVVYAPRSVITTQSVALASIPISMPLPLPDVSN